MAASNALHQCMMSDYGCVSRGLRVLLDVYRQANLPVRHIRKCRLQLCFINTSLRCQCNLVTRPAPEEAHSWTLDVWDSCKPVQTLTLTEGGIC